MEEQTQIRLDKLNKIREMGIDPYPYEFAKTHQLKDIQAAYEQTGNEDLEKITQEFKIAGRIMSIRKMGKSSFFHVYDGEAKLQVYIRQDRAGETAMNLFKQVDIGDIVGVCGTLFRTHSNELTMVATDLTFLTKALHPLPEKWHGLQDKEIRYRQRYLDLIVNEETRKTFNIRSRMIQTIRSFFYDLGYLEVETPMMQTIPGGAAARPFVTHHNALNIDLYLRVAPELYLKRLMVGGMEKIFEINRNFRNEGISQMHNPEFTMIEFYELYKDFHHYMELTENLFSLLNQQFLASDTIVRNDIEISLKAPFQKKRFMDLISENAGIAIEDLWDETKLADFIKKQVKPDEFPPTYGMMLELMFDHYVEHNLQQPTFVTYYPKAISPLSKRSRFDDRETERFELFIAGAEFANGFSELNDPIDQRERFEEQTKNREQGDVEAQYVDYGFLKALEHGMAPAAGEGIGIDRLIMLYTGAQSIKEVILFPLLKPKENEV
jgi:lysyl-tRNA synthetase class 2